MKDGQFGGPRSTLLVPVLRRSTNLEVGVHLAVITKKKIYRDNLASITDKILGYSIGINVIRQEILGYRVNPTSASIRDCSVYSLLGPCIVSPNLLTDPDNLDICLSYNNVILQSSNTRNTIMKTNKCLQYYSRFETLHEGTVLFTGSPEPNEFDKNNELVEISDNATIVASIDKIGFLDFTIRFIPFHPLSGDEVKISDHWKAFIKPSSPLLSL